MKGRNWGHQVTILVDHSVCAVSHLKVSLIERPCALSPLTPRNSGTCFRKLAFALSGGHISRKECKAGKVCFFKSFERMKKVSPYGVEPRNTLKYLAEGHKGQSTEKSSEKLGKKIVPGHMCPEHCPGELSKAR